MVFDLASACGMRGHNSQAKSKKGRKDPPCQLVLEELDVLARGGERHPQRGVRLERSRRERHERFLRVRRHRRVMLHERHHAFLQGPHYYAQIYAARSSFVCETASAFARSNVKA